jgi:hypothetical protein
MRHLQPCSRIPALATDADTKIVGPRPIDDFFRWWAQKKGLIVIQ